MRCVFPKFGHLLPSVIRYLQSGFQFHAQYVWTIAYPSQNAQIIVGKHPMNVETECTLYEFTDIVGMIALILTKSMGKHKDMTLAERIEWFLTDQESGLFITAQRQMHGVWLQIG